MNNSTMPIDETIQSLIDKSISELFPIKTFSGYAKYIPGIACIIISSMSVSRPFHTDRVLLASHQLSEEKSRGHTRDRAIQKLEVEKDIKALIAVISTEKEPVKRAAILALGRITDPEAVDALLRMFTEENEWYYDEIFEALGKSGDKRAIEQLLKMYRRFQLNPSLTEALGRLGDPRAVDLFKANLLDAGSSVRHAAAWGLIIFNDPATKEEAFSVLRDKEDITDAAATGSAKLVEMLLMAGVNVDTKTSGGYIPAAHRSGQRQDGGRQASAGCRCRCEGGG